MLEAASETANPPEATWTAIRKMPANKRPLLLRPNQQIKVPAMEMRAQITMER
jgi:hypothetical protein